MAAGRVKAKSNNNDNSNQDFDTDSLPPIIDLITQILLTPIRAATSPIALRTYASTALLLLTATALYLVAIVAYIIFYNAYIPDVNLIVPVHLQFDHLGHDAAVEPVTYSSHAVVDIASLSDRALGQHSSSSTSSSRGGPAAKPGRLISGLEYDIDVVVVMPRTPTNLAAGNFMLDLSMLGPSSSSRTASNALVLAHSSRPATLTYTPPLLSHAKQLLAMPFYVLNLRSDSETLRIPMLERVTFPRQTSSSTSTSSSSTTSATVPEQIRLEIKSRERLQVYAVTVEVQARFAGIRRLMSQHRLFSFALFTSLFWIGEMAVTLLVVGIASLVFSSLSSSSSSSSSTSTAPADRKAAVTVSSGEDERRGRIPASASTSNLKRGDDDLDLSDTDRTFPTYSRQPPLRYTSPTHVKREDADGDDDDRKDEVGALPAPATATTAGEADDEDDEDADFLVGEPGVSASGGGFNDSGIGTGVESSGGASARRRKSNK